MGINSLVTTPKLQENIKFFLRKSSKKTPNPPIMISKLKTIPPQMQIYISYIGVSLKLTAISEKSSASFKRSRFVILATANVGGIHANNTYPNVFGGSAVYRMLIREYNIEKLK